MFKELGEKIDQGLAWWKAQPWHKPVEFCLALATGAALGAGATHLSGYRAAGSVKPSGMGIGTHADNVGAIAGALVGGTAYGVSQLGD